jgi:hypothetical protein
MKITGLVEEIMKRYPQTRDSDKELIIGVLQASGAGLSERQREILRSINFESIRRYRQKLQEEGKYLPSPEVKAQRKLKAEIIKQSVNHVENPLFVELLNKPAPSWMDGIGSSV